MFDYHIHSDFSADCSTRMETTIQKAIEMNLTEICFTEHIDYDYPDKDWIFEFDLQEYDKKIKELQEKYRGKIRIKKGVEIGLQPHLLGKYESLTETEYFDFIICSMHATSGKDLHSGAFFAGKSVEEAYRIYYEELFHCINEYKNYSVLGHLDLVKRYTEEKAEDNFFDIIADIFNVVIQDGKGIEVNTSGYRYGLESGMPSADILKLYKDCGGEMITLGSDSHTETTLASRFRDTLELLSSIGFRYVATFEGQVPKMHPIEEVKKFYR